jgi:hypothetical protein
MNLFASELPLVASEELQGPELRNMPSFEDHGYNVMASISDIMTPGSNLGTTQIFPLMNSQI